MDNVTYAGSRYFDPRASSTGFRLYAVSIPHENGPWDAIFCKTEEMAKQVVEALAERSRLLKALSRIHDRGTRKWRDGNSNYQALIGDIEAIVSLSAEAISTTSPLTGRRAQAAQSAPTTFEPSNSCNRHDDCAKADEAAKSEGKFGATHCHDDCCEECFGN